MHNKAIKGISVISIADAERLGQVTRAYLDPKTMAVVGVVVDKGNGLMAPTSPMRIDAANVRSLGTDALMVDDLSVLGGDETVARYDDLVDLDSVLHHRVVTEGGTLVGQVASVSFDEQTFELTEVEASPGFFKSNKVIPIAQVVTIGTELIVVADAVCDDPGPTLDGADLEDGESETFGRVLDNRTITD